MKQKGISDLNSSEDEPDNNKSSDDNKENKEY